VEVGDEVFIKDKNKTGKVLSKTASHSYYTVRFDDGEADYLSNIGTEAYRQEKIQAIMKRAGIEQTTDDEEDRKKAEKERKKARLEEIRKKISNPTLIDALKDTTPATETLTIAGKNRDGLPNELLNENIEAINELLPNLKKLTINGKDKILVSTMPSTSTPLNDEVKAFFRRNIEELDLTDNYIEDLSWLRERDDYENKLLLKKLNLTNNHIEDLKYEDFMYLPEGAEVIIKNNPINNDAAKIQAFKDGLSTAGIKVKFIFE
jgi:hypothetical protein